MGIPSTTPRQRIVMGLNPYVPAHDPSRVSDYWFNVQTFNTCSWARMEAISTEECRGLKSMRAQTSGSDHPHFLSDFCAAWIPARNMRKVSVGDSIIQAPEGGQFSDLEWGGAPTVEHSQGNVFICGHQRGLACDGIL